MNREPCGGGVQDSWADVAGAVAAALADHPSSRENGSQHPDSLLTAVAGASPPGLRSRLQRQAAGDGAAGRPIEPLLHQNELPVYLLGSGIIDVAAHAVATWRKGVADGPAADDSTEVRVLAVVAISALSTLRLEVTGDDAVLAHVCARIGGFDASGWAEALASLADRTRELHDLLRAARNTRNHQWPRVSLEDQILAEAVAAAVVGGAAAASEVPPQQWLFPFHLFCKVAVSAAEDGLATIERWLGIDFLPAPRTIERSISLVVLATEQAASLWQGCACKTGTDPAELAYDPRGRCRQPDHDLRSWQPGSIRPGSRRGSRYASTLWGWLRRWLGGTSGQLGRSRLQCPGPQMAVQRPWRRRPGPALRPHPARVLPAVREQGPAGQPRHRNRARTGRTGLLCQSATRLPQRLQRTQWQAHAPAQARHRGPLDGRAARPRGVLLHRPAWVAVAVPGLGALLTLMAVLPGVWPKPRART